MKVAKWGNSLAVRLPKGVVETLGLKEGDDVEVVSAEGGDGRLALARRADRLQRIAELRRYRGLAPADFRFDREDANSRE